MERVNVSEAMSELLAVQPAEELESARKAAQFSALFMQKACRKAIMSIVENNDVRYFSIALLCPKERPFLAVIVLSPPNPSPPHLALLLEQKKKHEDIAQELETKLLRGKLKQMELEEGSVETSYPPIIQSGAAIGYMVYKLPSTGVRFSVQPTSVPCFLILCMALSLVVTTAAPPCRRTVQPQAFGHERRAQPAPRRYCVLDRRAVPLLLQQRLPHVHHRAV